MKQFARLLSCAIAIATLSIAVFAQTPAAGITVKDAHLFPLEEVRPGMKGTARTVFSGTEPEEFGIEILGVLPGFPGARQSAIIARLTGPNVAKTGVFGGMSGSPVYIDIVWSAPSHSVFPFRKSRLPVSRRSNK